MGGLFNLGAPHLTKGKQVVISGEVTLREYEKRDGTRGASLSVRVAEIDLVGGPREGEREGGGTHHPLGAVEESFQ